MRRIAGLALIIAIALAGCGGAPNPAYATPQRAIEGFLQMPVKVYQEVPTDGGKLLIFQGRNHRAPMVALVEEASWNRWRMWPGYDNGPLRNLGPVSIHTKVVGTVTQEYANGTRIEFGKTLTFYGVVNDPAITWVEVTLHERPDAARKAPVVNGTWLVQWPAKSGDPPYPKARLRAGDDSGVRFELENVWEAPAGAKDGCGPELACSRLSRPQVPIHRSFSKPQVGSVRK